MDRFSKKPTLDTLPGNILSEVYRLLHITPEEASAGDLRIFDTNDEDGLILVHYLNMIPAVYHVRGVIFDISDENNVYIAASSFPHTEEFNPSRELEVHMVVPANTIATKAYEGTVVRVFRKNDTWYMATHKKINGRRSRWCGPSFGNIFDELWKPEEHPYEDYLDTDGCYVFLISHPENRLVSLIPHPTLRLIGKFRWLENGDTRFDHFVSLRADHPEISTQRSVEFSSVPELFAKAREVDWKDCTGLLLSRYSDSGVLICVKLVPEGYSARRSLRGNEPNFRLRFFEHFVESEESLDRFRELFSEKAEQFATYEKDYNRLPAHLASLYKYKTTPEGSHQRMHQDEYYLTETVRRNYYRDMSLEDNFRERLKDSSARQLNALIKRMNNGESFYQPS